MNYQFLLTNVNRMKAKVGGVLSVREAEVVKLSLRRKREPEIAVLLHISKQTVHTHLQNARLKTESKSCIDLMHWYFQKVNFMNLENYLV